MTLWAVVVRGGLMADGRMHQQSQPRSLASRAFRPQSARTQTGSVQRATCNRQRVTCNMPCSAYSVQRATRCKHATCWQHATCNTLQCLTCNMQQAACNRQLAADSGFADLYPCGRRIRGSSQCVLTGCIRADDVHQSSDQHHTDIINKTVIALCPMVRDGMVW